MSDINKLIKAVENAIREKNEGTKEREELLIRYIALLSNEITSLISIAHIHGWVSPNGRVLEGERLREKLGLTEELINKEVKKLKDDGTI